MEEAAGKGTGMLAGKERYMVFGVGVLVGTVLFGFFMNGKVRSIEKRDAMDVEHGFNAGTRVYPGQVFKARSPVYAGAAIEDKTFDKDDKDESKRVVIFKDTTREGDPTMRFEEMLWTDSESGRERLICRQCMHADRLIVRKNPRTFNMRRFQEILKGHSMELIGPGRTEKLLEVQLPRSDVAAIEESIQLLSGYKRDVEVAVRSYILGE